MLLYFGWGSGMRISELCALSIGDVAPHGKVLAQVVLEKHSTQSGKSCTVHISKQAQRTLEAYLQARADRDNLTAPLFPSGRKPSGPLTANSAVTILAGMFAQAGISGASSHSLRRTHANALRREGADLSIIQ